MSTTMWEKSEYIRKMGKGKELGRYLRIPFCAAPPTGESARLLPCC